MKKKKKCKPPSPLVKVTTPTDLALIGLTTLLVARPLVPEDPGGQAGYGVAFIMLWLLLAIGWIAQQWRAKKPVATLDVADWLMIALIGWHSLAAIVAAMQASPRPAVNMLWEWVGLGLAFLLARRILSPSATARAVIAIMIGLAVGLSLVAIEQRFVSIPDDVRAFEAARDDPARLFELTGQWLPPGSSELTQFENRIRSQQPTATFALTNSLAGFLVPWFLMLTSVLLSVAFRTATGRTRYLVGGIAFLVISATLYFTSSRTALLAAACGLAGMALLHLPWRKIQLSAIAIAVLVAAIVTWQTESGREVLSGARRSLAFRAEYWQATLAMIADRPLLGWGPGQFQNSYTQYKLPTAPEEIQDPHNWLLEVTATAGVPAGVLLVALLIFMGWHLARLPTTELPDAPYAESFEPPIGAALGLILGSVLAFTNGFSLPLRQILLVAVGIFMMWWTLRPWVRTGKKLDTRVILIAAAALLLNLTAAGGIGYPSVAESLWLLAAVGLCASGEQQTETAKPASGGMRGATMAVCIVLFSAAYLTAYRPVTNSRAALVRANVAILRGQTADHTAAVADAVDADPWSARAALQLLSLRLAEYTNRPTAKRAEAVMGAAEELLRLAPRKSSAHARASETAESIYEKSDDANYLQSAIERQRQAVALYSTSAEVHARLAKLLVKAEESDSAAEEAREALRLDDLMREGGHADRQLTDELWSDLGQIASGEPTFDAEKPSAVE